MCDILLDIKMCDILRDIKMCDVLRVLHDIKMRDISRGILHDIQMLLYIT